MTNYSRLTLVLGGVALPLLASLPALAQDSATPPAPQTQAPQTETQQTEAAQPRRPQMTPADRAAFFDAHIAAVHAGLQLTPDQEKQWPALEKAVRDGMAKLAALREQRRTAAAPADRIEAMSRRAEADLTRGAAMKAIADAARPLYASLSDDQKRRLPMLMRAGRGNMGEGFGARGGRDDHHHGMGRGRGGDRGGAMHRWNGERGEQMHRWNGERGQGMQHRWDGERGQGMGRWNGERGQDMGRRDREWGRGMMMRRGDRDDAPRSRGSDSDRSDSGN